MVVLLSSSDEKEGEERKKCVEEQLRQRKDNVWGSGGQHDAGHVARGEGGLREERISRLN